MFKNCDKYKDEYNDIIVNVDELFDNQLNNIRNYVAKNSNLSIKQIDKTSCFSEQLFKASLSFKVQNKINI
mgnify:CR=1 FL=1